MVLLRFMSVSGICRQSKSLIRIAIPLGWLLVLLYFMIGALLSGEWLRTPHLTLSNDHDGLMTELGFVFDPILFPHAHHDTSDLPVFVIAIDSTDLHSFYRFLGSFRLYFRQQKLVLYDLGLTQEELKLVRHTCQCLVRTVHWDRYPAHVSDRTLKAYRPILIQETLREFGVVFWCNHKLRFNSSDISSLRSRAEAIGLVAWPAHPYPTSTFTHDGTFRYFGADRPNFHFLRMAEPDAALYANTYRLHHRLLRPWVSCALDLDCLSPRGAEDKGCDMTRRPRFRYTGCHRYDCSAFNVLLGEMFYHDDGGYIPQQAVFNVETVLPKTSDKQPRLFTLLPRRHVKTRTSEESRWQVAESEVNSDTRDPILFKQLPQIS